MESNRKRIREVNIQKDRLISVFFCGLKINIKI
ncbi:hypothetical protein Gste01_02285 [Geobacillus stearothermophilus ATCC 7953]|nr:hypothetical protein GC56T2_3484 [Geobacillus sp. C56-T2]